MTSGCVAAMTRDDDSGCDRPRCSSRAENISASTTSEVIVDRRSFEERRSSNAVWSSSTFDGTDIDVMSSVRDDNRARGVLFSDAAAAAVSISGVVAPVTDRTFRDNGRRFAFVVAVCDVVGGGGDGEDAPETGSASKSTIDLESKTDDANDETFDSIRRRFPVVIDDVVVVVVIFVGNRLVILLADAPAATAAAGGSGICRRPPAPKPTSTSAM